MRIREFKIEDLDEAERLLKLYQKGIDLPDFLTNYLCAFTVLDDDDSIITTGGVRTIAEACLITDKSKSTRVRVEALREVMKASLFIAKDFKFDWLHAITDDPEWANQMKKVGFVSRGEDLEFYLGERSQK